MKTKKGISGNDPCRASPRNPPSPDQRFPPKTLIRPPLRRIPMQTSCGSFTLPRDSPDSVISGPGPLMPERRIAPPLEITIPCVSAQRKRENTVKRGKNRPRTHFFRGGQICWSNFTAADGAKRKPHPERSPDAVKCDCSVRQLKAGGVPLISAEGIPEPGSAGPDTCSCTAQRADRR